MGESVRETAGHRIDVEFAEPREQGGSVFVGLADDVRYIRAAEQDVAHHRFEEVPFLFDHDDLVEPGDELGHDLALERVHHAHFQDPDAQAAQVGVGDTHQPQSFADVEVGLARRDDADPVVRGARDDPVEPVDACVFHRAGQADRQLVLFELHEVGAQQLSAGDMWTGAQIAVDGEDAVGVHISGGCPVGDMGGDLHRRPQAGHPRHDRGVDSEIEDVLGVGGIEDRHVQVGQRHLGSAGDGGTLGTRVIADQGDGAAGGVGADDVGVPEGIGGPVEAWSLAVPVADDAVERTVLSAVRQCPDLGCHLRTHHRCRGDLLVESRAMHHVEGVEVLGATGDLEVVTGERRTLVAGDERRCAQILPTVEAGTVTNHPDQCLDAGEVDGPGLAGVAVVQ